MSADYDRLFQSSSDDVEADEHTVHVDRDAILSGTAAPMPTGGAGRDEAARRRCPSRHPEPRPRRLRRRGRSEITGQLPPTPRTGPRRRRTG